MSFIDVVSSIEQARHAVLPALAWLVTLALCLWPVSAGHIDIYFASLPGWFIASLIYLVVSKVLQHRVQPQTV